MTRRRNKKMKPQRQKVRPGWAGSGDKITNAGMKRAKAKRDELQTTNSFPSILRIRLSAVLEEFILAHKLNTMEGTEFGSVEYAAQVFCETFLEQHKEKQAPPPSPVPQFRVHYISDMDRPETMLISGATAAHAKVMFQRANILHKEIVKIVPWDGQILES